MAGFDCEFVEQPPKYLQTEYPICLLILREPYQVTCCGKSFCASCIQQVKAKRQPCPTCKKDNFEHFPNKGLQQPLYGFSVFCCHKTEGCDWQGELRQLDHHLNLNPSEDQRLIGCAFAKVKCFYCDDFYERYLLEDHQLSDCFRRPITCSMCEEYGSTYDDVTKNHAPVCECRPVECPNACGDNNLQHQHLEEHLSSQCPLSLVECEFSHSGCDVEVFRKDLPSHLNDSMVTHMSLLASENRNLKLQLKKQAEEMKEQGRKIRAEMLRFVTRIPPLEISVPVNSNFFPAPFYSHGGHKLQLVVNYFEMNFIFYYIVFPSEFEVQSPCSLSITAVLMDQVNNKDHIEYKQEVDHPYTPENVLAQIAKHRICTTSKYVRNGHLLFSITSIRVVV